MQGLYRTFLLLVLLVLAGCATPTPYQQADPKGYGYAEQQLGSNRYRISFSGNFLTDRETVENYLLYRAAEVTLEQGYDYFVMADQNLEAKTSYTYTFRAFPDYGFYYLYPYSRGALINQTVTADAWPRTAYEAVANVVLFKGSIPEQELKGFDPRELMRYLQPSIRLPETAASQQNAVPRPAG